MDNTEQLFQALKSAISSYTTLSSSSWHQFSQICFPLTLAKQEKLCCTGKIPTNFAFLSTGLLRAFTTDEKGNEYNKIFFMENSFPASLAAMLTCRPSRFTIEALEPSSLLQIDYAAYRNLLLQCDDLKFFHILYLEKNWIIEKEERELALVQHDATHRYLDFLKHYPGIEQRLKQYHIASHLGVTPTQLSRIKKNLKNQPM